LVVHADDLAADEARNEGIFAAIDAGAVTAASILANGTSLRACLGRIASMKDVRFSWGVHLNLTEGKPLSAGLRLIVGPDGHFFGKLEGHRRFLNAGDALLEAEIRQEFSSQIRALCDAGVPVDHLDGHQHVHLFPAAFGASLWAAGEFGIPWMRVPEEPLHPAYGSGSSQALCEETRLFCGLAAVARSRLQGEAVRTTDHFRGLHLKGRFTLAGLKRILKTLPAGLTELMVHPGRTPDGPTPDGPPQNPFAAFSNRDRQKELDVLTGVDFHLLLEKYDVRLTCFPEVRS
jgi:predicted glycoside hydrolase/deacetylase ChbG (UPF0249 family)